MYEICLEIVFFDEVLALGMQSSFAKAKVHFWVLVESLFLGKRDVCYNFDKTLPDESFFPNGMFSVLHGGRGGGSRV